MPTTDDNRNSAGVPQDSPHPVDTAHQDPEEDVAPSASHTGAAKPVDRLRNALKQGGNAAGSGARALWLDPLICVRRLDALLDWSRATFPADLFTLITDWFARLGHVGLVVAAPIAVAIGFVGCFTERAFFPLLAGLGFVLLLAIVQYAAHKFLGAGDSLINASPSILTSGAFLNCIALISEATGILCFFWFLALAFRHGINQIWVGLGIAVLCDAVAYVAIHPQLVNTSVSETDSAGEEAIGILSFFTKTFMRLIPIVFGTGVALGTVALCVNLFSLIAGNLRLAGAFAPAKSIVSAALLPFAGYVMYAVYCLIVEVLRALLSLGKCAPRDRA